MPAKNPNLRLRRGATPSGSSLKSRYDAAMSEGLPRSPALRSFSPHSGSSSPWPTSLPHTPLYGDGCSSVYTPGNHSMTSLTQRTSPAWSSSPPYEIGNPWTDSPRKYGPKGVGEEYGYIQISRSDTPPTPGELSVSRPKPPTNLRRMSELIDPQSLASVSNIVESPSGNVLSKEAFAAREDRPLSLRERQERIRQEANCNHAFAVSGIAACTRPDTPTPTPALQRNLYNIAEENLVSLPPLPNLPDTSVPVASVKKHNKKTRCLCF